MNFPTKEEIEEADAEQLQDWQHTLYPDTDKEAKLYDLIVSRYLKLTLGPKRIHH